MENGNVRIQKCYAACLTIAIKISLIEVTINPALHNDTGSAYSNILGL